MGLSKYPVVSSTGAEYLVNVYEDRFNTFVVEVFVPTKRWHKKMKRVSGGMCDGRYDGDDWNYNLIAMAKNQIKKYEDEVEKTLLRNKTIEREIELFANWDGNIPQSIKE